MTFETLIAFCFASAIMTLMPGPTVLLITHYALQYGRWAGRYTVSAATLGDAVAAILALTGLGAILKIYPESFFMMKIIGGIYLVILGISSFFSKVDIEEENTLEHKPPNRKIFTHVFVVTASNPKSIVFLLAFFPQFINPAANTIQQFFVLGFAFVVVGGLGALTYDIAATRMSSWLHKPAAKNIIHKSTGIILIGLGLTTILF